jgi:hypothetical protein
MGPRGAWESARNDGQAYRQQHRCRRHRGGEALLTARASEIAKEIMASGEVAKSRATLNDRPAGQGHRRDV